MKCRTLLLRAPLVAVAAGVLPLGLLAAPSLATAATSLTCSDIGSNITAAPTQGFCVGDLRGQSTDQTFTLNVAGMKEIDVLLVAGGGGGGGGKTGVGGGAGGNGGAYYDDTVAIPAGATTVEVRIGRGGDAGDVGMPGTDGSSSWLEFNDPGATRLVIAGGLGGQPRTDPVQKGGKGGDGISGPGVDVTNSNPGLSGGAGGAGYLPDRMSTLDTAYRIRVVQGVGQGGGGGGYGRGTVLGAGGFPGTPDAAGKAGGRSNGGGFFRSGSAPGAGGGGGGANDLNPSFADATPPGEWAGSAGNPGRALIVFSLDGFSPGPSPGPGPSPDPSPTPPAPPVPPSAPDGVVAIPGDGRVTLLWSAPSTSGSFSVSSYQATVSPGGQSCLVTITTCTITGLTNGTSHTAQVRALSGAGWGPYSSASAAFTPAVNPQPTPPAPQPIPAPLLPGQSSASENGQPVTIAVDPNATNAGLVISGDGFEMQLDGLDAQGRPLNLGPDGVLVLREDREVQTFGSGFAPRTPVGLYIDPPVATTGVGTLSAETGLLIGTLTVDGNGEFLGTAVLPDGIQPGDHVLQGVGTTPSGASRAVSIGVRVEPDLSLTLNKRERVSLTPRLDRIRSTGSSVNVPVGTKLSPMIRFGSEGEFQPGKATIIVQEDGTFRWTRKVRANRPLVAYVGYTDASSNTVRWARIR